MPKKQGGEVIINGKKLSVRVDLGAMKLYRDLTGGSLLDVDWDNITEEVISDVIAVGILRGNQKDMDITEARELADLVQLNEVDSVMQTLLGDLKVSQDAEDAYGEALGKHKGKGKGR